MLSLGEDTYSFCFKAYHRETADEMQISEKDRFGAIQGVLITVVLQTYMLFVMNWIIFDWETTPI